MLGKLEVLSVAMLTMVQHASFVKKKIQVVDL